MNISELAKHLGITAVQLAEMAGVSRQVLNDYTRGRRGRKSEFVARVLQVSGLLREEFFFPDAFDHPDACDQNRPQYWMSIAIEALQEAKKRGIDCDGIAKQIFSTGQKGLAEL